MSGMLVDKAKNDAELRVKMLARKIARESPTLRDLPPEEQEKIARLVMVDNLRDDLKRAVMLEKIDLDAERTAFLKRLLSAHTRKAYTDGLRRIDEWCARRGITMLDLTTALADDWIVEVRSNGHAPSTVRLYISSVSSFCSWLHDRHNDYENPFRGTRERPKLRGVRALAVPSDAEMKVILKEAKGDLRGAILVMSRLGLRVGGLQSFSINGQRWTATSKGKPHSGPTKKTQEAFEEVRRQLLKLKLSLKSPFAEETPQVIADRFRCLTKRLAKRGLISGTCTKRKVMVRGKRTVVDWWTSYSVHDLRHYFATRFYNTDAYDGRTDIYALKNALGHSDIGITERYLKSIENIA